MGPLLNTVTSWYKKKTTLLDGKRRSGSLKGKEVDFLNDVMSLLFLPFCAVLVFFLSCDRILKKWCKARTI